jgi:ubiquinone/menaquinone biosynthesis C-methylase UbiE
MTRFPSQDNRKSSERSHYERVAALHALEISQVGIRSGPESVASFLQAPYEDFARIVRAFARRGAVIIDLAAGTGVHSLAAGPDATIVALDISPESLMVAKRRSEASGISLLLAVADGEKLPLRDGGASVVTSAGSLYCFDLSPLVEEVARVLAPKGAWVIVDSFRHNPVYSANRIVGYLRGRRTRLAVTNIPGRQTVKVLSDHFEKVSVTYYGIFSFLGPLLSILMGNSRTKTVLDALDRRMQWAGILAFKIVIVALQPRVST